MALGDTYDHSNLTLEQIFTISYTSGTEKNPKGVMINNRNFISALTNIIKVGEGYEVC
jgi:long-subunit acyl-CoA synthetase (AMP-forming)